MTITIKQYLENAQKKVDKLSDADRKESLTVSINSLKNTNNIGSIGMLNTTQLNVESFISDYAKMSYKSLKKTHKNDEEVFFNIFSSFVSARNSLTAYLKKNRISPDNIMEKKLPIDMVACKTVLILEKSFDKVDMLSADAGKTLLNRVKDSYEQAQMEVMSHKKFRGFDLNSIRENPAHNLSEDIENLRELLKSGDSMVRGSSDEYKEIKRDLKELDNYFADVVDVKGNHRDRMLQVKIEMIMEKAKRYIKSHREVSENYSETSYKGKRVKIMKEVMATLHARYRCFNCKDDTTLDLDGVKSLANEMKNDFGKGLFSADRYAEIVAYNDIINESKPKGKTVEFNNQRFEIEGNSDRNIGGIICDRSDIFVRVDKICENKNLELLEKAFSGRAVSYEKAGEMLEKANNYIEKVQKLTEKEDAVVQEKIGITDRNCKKLRQRVRGIDALDNMVYEQKNDSITGDSRYDYEIMKYARNILKNCLAERTANKANVEALPMEAGY